MLQHLLNPFFIDRDPAYRDTPLISPVPKPIWPELVNKKRKKARKLTKPSKPSKPSKPKNKTKVKDDDLTKTMKALSIK